MTAFSRTYIYKDDKDIEQISRHNECGCTKIKPIGVPSWLTHRATNKYSQEVIKKANQEIMVLGRTAVG